MKRGSSNRAFRKSKNVRKGSGPVHYKWQPKPFEKIRTGRQREERITEIKRNSPNPIPGCNGPIDNVVMYVWESMTDGNHSSYVECDYVD